MAKMPAAAAKPPMDDDDDTDQTAGQGAEGEGGDEEGEDSEPTGKVIATIVDAGDGTFILYAGDEPEEGEGDEDEGAAAEGGESEGGAEGEEGPENAPEEGEAGEGESEEGPEPEHFDSPGPLLKRVLDILNEAEANNGSGEHAFAAGFGASHEPTPKR